jgi:Tol biopolymer transport system component
MKITTIDLETEVTQQISPEAYAYTPSWSQDGAYLAFLDAMYQ